MISTGQILTAAIVTGIAVGVAAGAVRWHVAWLAVASVSSFALLVAWRAFANTVALNGDFLPAVSVGDAGCLLAGGLGPLLVARLGGRRGAGADWAPAAVGAIVGFVVNVAIL
jgi:hypothetical protein